MKLNFAIFLTIFCAHYSTQQTTEDLCQTLSEWSKSEISSQCMNQLQTMCHNGSLWWRMFDASSKYPYNGMVYSNNRDLGNYDECVNINYRDEIKGKFCAFSVAIINLFLKPIPNPYKIDIDPKPLALLSNVTYTNNRVPREDITDKISLSLLSMCIPDKCTSQEVGTFFVWGQVSNQPIVSIRNDVPCMTLDSYTTFEWGDIVFTTVLALILFFIVAGTVYDFILQKMGLKLLHPILIAFSLLTNGKKLFAISHSKSPGQIQCLNGLRFISMMWVITGHGYVAFESLPIINYAELAEWMNNPRVQYAAAGPLAVDTFFVLSGFLMAFGYLKNMSKRAPAQQAMGIPMMIFHRYLRLTPALAILYFACITIFKMLGNGPLWGTVATGLRQQCVDHWWSFFLYIQNYVNYNDMCLNHSWYLSADMQMFILAPIVLIPLTVLLKQRKINVAIIGLVILIIFSVAIPIGIRFVDHSIDNVYDTHSRFVDYLIGVLLGVIMRDERFNKFPFSKLMNLAIWCCMIVVCILMIIYYHVIVRVYEHTSDTLFYGLYRPVWCTFIVWIIYSCYHGYGGPVGWLLSLPAFQVGARLSYCMYLLHAVVQMYYVGLARTWYFWSDYSVFYVWCGHFIVTMVLSAVWSLAFESPMIVIEKLIFGGGRAQRPKNEVNEAPAQA